MSYANVASHNTSGYQPKPDPALLTTPSDVAGSHTSLPDVDAKFTVVPNDYNGETQTSQLNHLPPQAIPAHEKNKSEKRKEQAKEKLHEAEEEGIYLWEQTKQRVLQPGFLGGLVGVVNVGLIGAFSYQLYAQPRLRSDTRYLSTAGVSALALFGLEGWVAESYAKTPAGQREAERAKKEGAMVYRHAREVVLRPGVLGGFVGVLNLGVLGGVGYAAYQNWDRPHWDRRTVSAVTVGVLSLFSVEGYLGEQYREHEYPKRK